MLSNVELGAYLKKIRESEEISLREVEKLTGVGYSHLSMIENGKRNVTPALLKNLSRIYGIDYIDLYEKAGYLDLAESERLKNNSTDNKRVFPLLGTVKAGYDYLANENIIGYINIDKKISDPENYFALKVIGDSMQPVLYEDDIIVVHKQSDVESGQIAIVLVDGEEGTVKKVIKYDNYIELVAFNSYYPPRKLSKNDNFKIIGKVVEARISKIFE